MRKYIACGALTALLTTLFLLLPSALHRHMDRRQQTASLRTLSLTGDTDAMTAAETLQLLMEYTDRAVYAVCDNRYRSAEYRQQYREIITALLGTDSVLGEYLLGFAKEAMPEKVTTYKFVAVPDGKVTTLELVLMEYKNLYLLYDSRHRIVLYMMFPWTDTLEKDLYTEAEKGGLSEYRLVNYFESLSSGAYDVIQPYSNFCVLTAWNAEMLFNRLQETAQEHAIYSGMDTDK